MTLLLKLCLWTLLVFLPVKSQCPEDYSEHPLIIMSLDGFRADYIGRKLTPTLEALAEEGVTAPFMRASYPTVTFPNHYTIATGLYPESHGIIANSFSEGNKSFTSSNGAMSDGYWWGGEPIWNTVIKAGKISAAYFWPGSEADIQGLGPNYTFPYDSSVPFQERIQQVLDWLVLPVGERPSWICVYFNEPDHTGHRAGPDSWRVNEQLVRMDNIVKMLVDGITDLGLRDCTNLLFVSDHGMAKAGQENVVEISDYLPDLRDYGFLRTGVNARIDLDDDQGERQEDAQESLSCKLPSMRQFDRTTIPKRYHFSNNRRIEEIVLDFDPGHAANFESDFYLEGNHGFDNDFREMQALFIANGPDINSGLRIKPFQNIEVYNLMCDLLSLDPAPNNGTKGALYQVLKSPPSYQEFPQGTNATVDPFPTQTELPNRVNNAECVGDLVTVDDYIDSLEMTSAEQATLEQLHLPWGIPYLLEDIDGNVTLLHHDTHVTGYSKTLKMPLWTSYTLAAMGPGTVPTAWSSDVRLTADETQTCPSYDYLIPQNMTMLPLFRPEHSSNTSDPRIPYIVSNAIPMTEQLEARYLELINELIPAWILNSRSPLNIVAGPVFDSNFDSHFDNYTEFTSFPEAPSEFFVIITRCNVPFDNLTECPPNFLDVQSFIYHQKIEVGNCLVRDYYAEEYSARVKDVELATGLIFYPSLSFQDAIAITLHLHIDIWTTIEQ